MIRKASLLFLSRATRFTGTKGLKQAINGARFLSSEKGKDKIKIGDENRKIPNEFFDDALEDEKEFLDIATALGRPGGLENLTIVKDPLKWDIVDDETYKPSDFVQNMKAAMASAPDETEDSYSDNMQDQLDPKHNIITQSMTTDDIAKHLENLPNAGFIPSELLNYTVPWRMTEEFPEPLLENFVPNTSSEKYRFDRQGERACVGGLQRKGKKGELQCHLIDMDDFHHLDVLSLRRFMSDDSEILGKKLTGLCSKCQRKVAKTIKRARNIGIVPHIGEYTLQDSRPLHRDEHYHDNIGNEYTKSKTIL